MKFRELFGKGVRPPTSRSLADRICLRLEQLESRVVPYSVSGNAWPNPQLVTLSFVPDGTWMTTNNGANVYSNLFATFNAKFGSPAAWEGAIITAAQTWAAQANLNLSVVSDNGIPAGQGNYQQGDPGMGDVRIGGFAFSTKYLAGTYLPPSANNYSIAGDMNFNTAQTFNIGTTYDLQTVALHEFGHAFGLNHSTVYGAVMYPYYKGKNQVLSSDDVNGIQAIYGARPADGYNSGGASNSSFLAAANLTSLLGLVVPTTQVSNLDLTSPSQVEYFTVTAPLLTDGTLTVNVQSSGMSLLRPALTVYAADQVTVLGSASGAGSYNGATLSVPVTGVTAGQQVYVAVSGADSSAFGTGAYTLGLSFASTAPLPAVALPITQVLNGLILTGGGAVAMAVVDLMAVDNTVGCGDTFAGNGHRHGGGCGCPLCRPAGIITDPFVGVTGTAFQVTGASQTQQPTATQVLGLDITSAGDAASQTTGNAWLQAFDAVFQALQSDPSIVG
jgi:matrixin